MSIHDFLASFQLKDAVSILVSAASFVLAGFALWVAQFKRGRLKMTQPKLLCLKRELAEHIPKIFLRTLLFTTGAKGRVIESMFLKVHQSHGSCVFDFWGHSEGGKLTIGSGLYVGPTGIACDHHFNPRRGSQEFLFVPGPYRVEIFAALVGQARPQKLHEITFTVDGQQSAELIQILDLELFLTWNADSRTYDSRLDRAPNARVR